MYAGAVQDLIDELGRLPGVGPKSAQRIAFHLLKLPAEDALRLATAINVVKSRVVWCTRCFNVAEADVPAGDLAGTEPLAAGGDGTEPLPAATRPGRAECDICRDPRRDTTVVCVVEEPRDIVAVEKTHEYRGRYHVLQGAMSPIDGITEVILCTNPNIEGEATALYLASLLKEMPVRVTRIASGLPVGGDLEYADELTLGRAIEGRRDVNAS